jgi:hypothetical protein
MRGRVLLFVLGYESVMLRSLAIKNAPVAASRPAGVSLLIVVGGLLNLGDYLVRRSLIALLNLGDLFAFSSLS